MNFNNNYLNVIHVLQCTENTLFNTVPVIKRKLTEICRYDKPSGTCTIHLTTDIQIQKLRIWSKDATPPPSPCTMSHMQLFASIVYTCVKSWGQEQQRITLNPDQILINTHMTALLKRKSLGSKFPLDLSVDQFYINSIMRVWTLKEGMQSLSWLHIVFPLQE